MGNMIKKEEYGNSKSIYGWDGDHSKPLSKGGTYHKNNLHALQSQQNRYQKNDTYPYHYNQQESIGKSVASVQKSSEVDLRSHMVQAGGLYLNTNGTVSGTSSAVKSGEVKFCKDGSIDRRCSAARSGALKFKN